jgi:ABC-type phosphate/phosphonate transport system substrate-binding protein
MVGNLGSARNLLDGVREGRIDVGPVDAYWHLLIRRHAPQLAAGIRVLTSTELTPMPPFVAAGAAPAEMVARLRAAFTAAARQAWFARLADLLLIEGFAEVDAASLAHLLEWDREARAAGFATPA